MENQPTVPQNEDEMLARLREEDATLPQADKGNKKALQIGVVAMGMVLLTGIFFWIFAASPTPAEKKSEKVSAANRGLAAAGALRSDKELFGQAERPQAMPAKQDSKIPGLSNTGFPDGEGGAPTKDFDDLQPKDPSPSIPVRRPKGPLPSGAGGGVAGPRQAAEYTLPRELEIRLSENYQKALQFYASEQVVYSRATNALAATGNPLGGVDSSLRNLTDRPQGFAGTKIVVSAGSELTATLNEALNTDYPSVVKATITSPPELSGAIALLSYALGNERASAQVGKIVLPSKSPNMKAKELAVASVVKSGLPGLGGDVNHHWGPQIAAGLANAGLTAGALAYASKQSSSDNLGTAVLLAPVIQQGVEGVLKPINYLGRERPITVTVPAGTEFTILVTEGFEVTP
jgi:type IV secretory pathway VirB10-like protein